MKIVCTRCFIVLFCFLHPLILGMSAETVWLIRLRFVYSIINPICLFVCDIIVASLCPVQTDCLKRSGMAREACDLLQDEWELLLSNYSRHKAERLRKLDYLFKADYQFTHRYAFYLTASFFLFHWTEERNASSVDCSFTTSCACGELLLDSRVESREGAPQSVVELRCFITLHKGFHCWSSSDVAYMVLLSNRLNYETIFQCHLFLPDRR